MFTEILTLALRKTSLFAFGKNQNYPKSLAWRSSTWKEGTEININRCHTYTRQMMTSRNLRLMFHDFPSYNKPKSPKSLWTSKVVACFGNLKTRFRGSLALGVSASQACLVYFRIPRNLRSGQSSSDSQIWLWVKNTGCPKKSIGKRKNRPSYLSPFGFSFMTHGHM